MSENLSPMLQHMAGVATLVPALHTNDAFSSLTRLPTSGTTETKSSVRHPFFLSCGKILSHYFFCTWVLFKDVPQLALRETCKIWHSAGWLTPPTPRADERGTSCRFLLQRLFSLHFFHTAVLSTPAWYLRPPSSFSSWQQSVRQILIKKKKKVKWEEVGNDGEKSNLEGKRISTTISLQGFSIGRAWTHNSHIDGLRSLYHSLGRQSAAEGYSAVPRCISFMHTIGYTRQLHPLLSELTAVGVNIYGVQALSFIYP